MRREREREKDRDRQAEREISQTTLNINLSLITILCDSRYRKDCYRADDDDAILNAWWYTEETAV